MKRRTVFLLVGTVLALLLLVVLLPREIQNNVWDFLTRNVRSLVQPDHESIGWQMAYDHQGQERQLTITSPVFEVDQIYPSMKGPASVRFFHLENFGSELAWIHRCEGQVWKGDLSQTMSDDFWCHNNLDYGTKSYFQKWGLEERATNVNPRLFTLTQGQMLCQFPKGFGLPLYTSDNLSLASQALNLNISEPVGPIRHKTILTYSLNKELAEPLKPLYQQSIFIMQRDSLYTNDPGAMAAVEGDCRPGLSSAANKVLLDNDGTNWTGHWRVSPGRDTVRYNVTYQLRMPFNTTLHQAMVHIHPFAEKLELIDLTTGEEVLSSKVLNFSDKKGLQKVELFSDTQGIPFYQNHEYELVCYLNNTTEQNGDMMAVMLLYFLDKDIEEKIKALQT